MSRSGVTAGPAGAANKVVTPGAVTVLNDTEMTLPVLPAPADGRIAGYGFTVEVTGNRCAASVGDPGDAITAAGGAEVCVFSLTLDYDQPDTTAGTTPVRYPATGWVAVGGKVLPITTAELDDANDPADYAVAVPQGSPAVLSLAAAGFSQSFSLGGRPTGVHPAALYRSASAYELAYDPATQTTLAEDASPGVADLQLVLSQVQLDYFRPGDATVRAPADGAYLAVVFSTAEVPGRTGVAYEGFTPLPGDDVRLALPGGAVLDGQYAGTGSDLLAGAWLFLVPADLQAATVLVTPGTKDGMATGGRRERHRRPGPTRRRRVPRRARS